MRAELEAHLEQAVRDGKALDAVVGAKTLAFAEAWARETPHQFASRFGLLLRWLAFDWLASALLFLFVIALVAHLLFRSPSFPFSLAAAVSVAFIGLFTLLRGMVGFLSPRIRSRETRLTLTFGVYALISLSALLILILVAAPLHRVLFRWDWPVTVLLIVSAGGLFGLKFRLARATRAAQQP